MTAWNSNGREAGRMHMMAINPDFSATATCITAATLLSDTNRKKHLQHFVFELHIDGSIDTIILRKQRHLQNFQPGNDSTDVST